MTTAARNKVSFLGPNIRQGYGTHLPVLAYLVELLDDVGPLRIVEYGGGWHSTLFLHALSARHYVTTVENADNWVPCLKPLEATGVNGRHRVLESPDMKLYRGVKADIAMIDCDPQALRGPLLEDVRKNATYVVCHDTEPQHRDVFKWPADFSSFKHAYEYTTVAPETAVLSDVDDLATERVFEQLRRGLR